MPVVERVFVFLTEDKHDKNPFKILETVGKELITGVLHGLLEKDVLKLEEAEKKKFYDAKPEDKPRVFLNSVRQKRQEAGQALVQTFINTDKYSASVKGKLKSFNDECLKFSRFYLTPRSLRGSSIMLPSFRY